MEQLEASILNTIFRNEENGYSVVEARAGREKITVVGTLPALAAGEQVLLSGMWVEHLDGSDTSVIGLPLYLVRRLLLAAGYPLHPVSD